MQLYKPLKLDVIQTCNILDIVRISGSGNYPGGEDLCDAPPFTPLRWGKCRGHITALAGESRYCARCLLAVSSKWQPAVSSMFHWKHKIWDIPVLSHRIAKLWCIEHMFHSNICVFRGDQNIPWFMSIPIHSPTSPTDQSNVLCKCRNYS